MSHFKTPLPAAGPTCQLCLVRGHTARSCPTHLSDSATIANLRSQVDHLDDMVHWQKARLVALDSELDTLRRTVNDALAMDEECESDEEQDKENARPRKINVCYFY